MGFDTQAILPGHPTAEDLAEHLSTIPGVRVLEWRTMRHPDHVIFDIATPTGHQCIEAFLNSFAASDHADTFTGPSTLLTTEYSANSLQFLSLLTGKGGFVREHDMAAWGQGTACSGVGSKQHSLSTTYCVSDAL
jgi:hypothetical protein